MRCRKSLAALLTAVILIAALSLTACSGGGAQSSKPPATSTPPETSAPPASSTPPADSASSEASSSQQEMEDWREEQKIVANGETYITLLQALLSEEEDKPLTIRLDSDVQLTNFSAVLGASDYGGLFGGREVAVPSHDITLDLNGHTLTAEQGCAVFEVQDGYTLTVVDNSQTKGGSLKADGEAVIVADGGAYVPLS